MARRAPSRPESGSPTVNAPSRSVVTPRTGLKELPPWLSGPRQLRIQNEATVAPSTGCPFASTTLPVTFTGPGSWPMAGGRPTDQPRAISPTKAIAPTICLLMTDSSPALIKQPLWVFRAPRFRGAAGDPSSVSHAGPHRDLCEPALQGAPFDGLRE